MSKGKLIAIEGTDGSGKATQVGALVERIKTEGMGVVSFSFPRYNTTTGRAIRAYLDGEFGEPTALPPKLCSQLYAADRFAAKSRVAYYLNYREIVLCDRYVASNMAHQGAKLPEEEREKFFRWVEDYEFGELKIPKPDLTICLHIPIEVTQKALAREGKEQDGHEKNRDYQKKVYETYMQLSKRADWRVIECMERGRRKTIEEVTGEIWEIVYPLLTKN